MVCILVISTIIYKSLCPLALLHCCYEGLCWESPREPMVHLSSPPIHHPTSCLCHFIYPNDQKKAVLLITNVCTLCLQDPSQVRQHTKTSAGSCVSEVVLVAISKWDALDVVKCWKRVEPQMWCAVSLRNYFNYVPLHAAHKASQQ